MSSAPEPIAPVPGTGFFPRVPIERELGELRKNWGWFLVLGVLLILVGMLAISYAFMATITTVLVFGWFMLVGGFIHLIGCFQGRGWGGFFLHLLVGVLYLAAGFIVINHPGEAAVVYTLLLAVFFFVEGLFRLIGALAGQFSSWGWVALSGLITLVLGVMIWRQWPYSGLWVIGLFVGIDLIFNGWTWVMLALAAKNIPQQSATTPAA